MCICYESSEVSPNVSLLNIEKHFSMLCYEEKFPLYLSEISAQTLMKVKCIYKTFNEKSFAASYKIFSWQCGNCQTSTTLNHEGEAALCLYKAYTLGLTINALGLVADLVNE